MSRLLVPLALLLAVGVSECTQKRGGGPSGNQAPRSAMAPMPAVAAMRPDASRQPPEPRLAAGVVLFTAKWCPTCYQLKERVFATAAGKRLLQGMPLRTVDFDAPANQALVIKNAVTGLPTTMFLRKDGTEIDRIVGFEDAEQFLAEARAIRAGRDGLHLLEDRLLRQPDSVELLFKTGYKLLLRGQEKVALERYRRILALDPENKTGYAAQVMMHRGRYLVRAKRDYEAAIKLLRRAVKRYGSGRDGPGLVYWLGWAQCKAGKKAAAAKTVDRFALQKQRSAKALTLAAGLRRKCEHELAQALMLAQEAVKKDPKHDWGWYLVADLSLHLGKKDDARHAIAKAVALDPKSAFYQNEQQRMR